VIDAPTLGIENQTVALPCGVMLGLINQRFTADGEGLRCQGQQLAEGQLGCFVARAPEGKSAAWVLAGQLRLAQVTGIANQLAGVLGGEGADVPVGDLLTAVLPLLRSLQHGIDPSLEIEEHPKVDVTTGTPQGCDDATVEGYAERCRGDYARYQRVDLTADKRLSVLSRVRVPNLPDLPGGGCAGGAVLVSAAILPGRGVLPLGLSAGLDVLGMGTPDCRIEGVRRPFGEQSPTLENGQLPLTMAPPHSGIEGSQLALLVVAIDPNTVTSALQLNAIVERVTSVRPEQDLSPATYLPYPTGQLDRGGRTFAFSQAVTGATATRVEVQRGDETWLVYAPAGTTNVAFPDVETARDVLANATATLVQAMRIDGDYVDLWRFGSGKTLDRLVETINAFVVTQCQEGGACTIQ
jgi:hypothetical protein